MKIIQGDLLQLAEEGKFDVIVQGCNCHHTMGGGIARSIKSKFPEAYAADLQTESGSREKLGSISTAEVECSGRALTIDNAYTQFNASGSGVLADYNAIREAFALIKSRFTGQRIGYPKIGAGLAGGDWNMISIIIDEELAGEDHTLVEYQPQC